MSLLKRLGGDGVLAVLFIVASGVAYRETLSFPERAAHWPQVLLIVFALLSLTVIVMKLAFPEDAG
jgi:hypothetical protein